MVKSIFIYACTYIYIYKCMYVYVDIYKSFSLQSGPITLHSGPIESWVQVLHSVPSNFVCLFSFAERCCNGNHSASLSEFTWHSRCRYQNMKENILENKIWQSKKNGRHCHWNIHSLLKTRCCQLTNQAQNCWS